ncbi:MAG TPA: site-2 protease family protein [Pirellulales bacterium]|jgi:Zn-dependent protease|nr:site-2 protease family protein [Pirellulales bacterium]
MRDLLSWNLSLGRWGGVQVRLHVFFLLFAAVALHLSSQTNNDKLLWETSAVLAILFFSVLAHELGHCLAARRVGGAAEQILLWPLGGLTQVHVSHEPQSEWLTAAAGPAVNLAACLFTAPVLIVNHCHLAALLNPLLPPAAEELSWLNACEWLFWVNWLLALVNLLPALPFDMGRALRAMLWMHHEPRYGVVRAARVAQVTAIVLLLVACGLTRIADAEYRFAALPVALVGILLFFGAKQEIDRLYDAESEDALFGYDFSQGYTSLEKTAPPRKPQVGPLRKWLEERRANKLKRQQQLEADEERRVDEVLLRLHQLGMPNLSEEERALLNRVSARYRNRLRE